MRNDAAFREYSVTSESKGDGSTRVASTDPDLQAIRSVIEPGRTKHAAGQAVPSQTGKRVTMQDRQDQLYERSIKKPSLPQMARRLATSFIGRPDAPRLLACLCLLISAFLQPGFIMFLVVISLLTALVLFFSFGPDSAETWVINRYKHLHERDPDAAESIRLRAARASNWLSEIIEKLPKKWTTGLYLPDFEEPAKLPDKLKTDPFERLERQ